MFSLFLLCGHYRAWQHYRVSDLSFPVRDADESSVALETRREGSDAAAKVSRKTEKRVDVYFSADVETDGPIPGPYSMLSFALVYAGRFDGTRLKRPANLERTFYRELRPISATFGPEALVVNGLDRERLAREGESPELAMSAAAE